jgi:hypothetical protein
MGWTYFNSGNSLDDLCESFSNVILQAAGESILHEIITVRKTDPPWMNGAIRRVIRKRNRLQKQAKKSYLPVHWASFRKSRNKIINLIRRQKELYFDNLIAKLKSRQTSARDWWKSASQLVGRNSNNFVIPPLNCSNNIVYDDVEKAEAFNTFFRLNQILMILTNQYQLTIRRHWDVWIVLFFGNMKFQMYWDFLILTRHRAQMLFMPNC